MGANTSDFFDDENDLFDVSRDDNSNELFEHFHFTVDKGQSMVRIDKYLVNNMQNTSRNRIQTAADNGLIFVNDKPVKSNYKIKPLD